MQCLLHSIHYTLHSLGGPTPFLSMEKCVFSHFFPWGKMGKKYMEREGNEYFSLSFHIIFFPFFPMGKNGKTHIFPWAEMGLDPPTPYALLQSTVYSYTMHYTVHSI